MAFRPLPDDYFTASDASLLKRAYLKSAKGTMGGQQGFARSAGVSQGTVSNLFGTLRRRSTEPKNRPRPTHLLKVINALVRSLRDFRDPKPVDVSDLEKGLTELAGRVHQYLPRIPEGIPHLPGEIVRAESRYYIKRSIDSELEDMSDEVLRYRRNIQISGPPGTGKSSVLRRWLLLFERRGVPIARVDRGGPESPSTRTDLLQNILRAACVGWNLGTPPSNAKTRRAITEIPLLAEWLCDNGPRRKPKILVFEGTHAFDNDLQTELGSTVDGATCVYDLTRTIAGKREPSTNVPCIILTTEPGFLRQSAFEAWKKSTMAADTRTPDPFTLESAKDNCLALLEFKRIPLSKTMLDVVDEISVRFRFWPEMLHLAADAIARNITDDRRETMPLGDVFPRVPEKLSELPLERAASLKLKTYLDKLVTRQQQPSHLWGGEESFWNVMKSQIVEVVR